MQATTMRISSICVETLAVFLFAAVLTPGHAEWTSRDGSLTARGFVQAEAFTRKDEGLTKGTVTGQLEFNKVWQPRSFFSELSLSGTLRGSYDSAYDIRDSRWGKKAGGSVSYQAPGNPSLFAFINQGTPPFPDPSTNPVYAGMFGPASLGANGAIPLPGTGGTIASARNPNDGLRFAAGDVYNYQDGGTILATPVRPCDVDSRGCLKDYMDKDLDELRFREFNDDLDFIRELYLDMAFALSQGKQEVAMRVGRQQIVWGRTDLFRVLDVVNPMDFSMQNLYTEFEDQRIPQGILNVEYRLGATKWFEDFNIQALWKFEEARPHVLGQGGTPYAILGAGNLFRALANCWQSGCTVGNFPATGTAVDFPAGAIGIRNVNLPNRDDIGARIEGVFKGVGFSLNALYYSSQFPSLRGGVPAINPFVCQAGLPCFPGQTPPPNPAVFYPYNFAFDIEFPRLLMVGGSVDWYSEWAKSSFRIETSYTKDEEFANTLRERLFSESDVFRWVIGFDRPTFIPFLNKTRAFLISGQIFGQHLLDHEEAMVNVVQAPGQSSLPTLAPVGVQDWEDNIFLTLLIQGNYFNDRLTPQLITAYDTEAKAGVAGISLEFKPSNNWVWRAAFNLKWSDGADEWIADDNRSANIFPPFTCNPALLPPATLPPDARCFAPYSSVGLSGFEPLGRFRAGPIGAAHNEDEFQITVRYQF